MKKEYFSPELDLIKLNFESLMEGQQQDVSQGESAVDDFSEIEM